MEPETDNPLCCGCLEVPGVRQDGQDWYCGECGDFLLGIPVPEEPYVPSYGDVLRGRDEEHRCAHD